MGGLFEPICMGSSTERAYRPEMVNWMHADLQIEVENRILTDDQKTPVGHAQGSFFFREQKNIVLPVPSGVPSIAPTLNYL